MRGARKRESTVLAGIVANRWWRRVMMPWPWWLKKNGKRENMS